MDLLAQYNSLTLFGLMRCLRLICTVCKGDEQTAVGSETVA
jgi:hypothetical protein